MDDITYYGILTFLLGYVVLFGVSMDIYDIYIGEPVDYFSLVISLLCFIGLIKVVRLLRMAINAARIDAVLKACKSDDKKGC